MSCLLENFKTSGNTCKSTKTLSLLVSLNLSGCHLEIVVCDSDNLPFFSEPFPNQVKLPTAIPPTRLNTIMDSDKVVVLSDGRLVEADSPSK